MAVWGFDDSASGAPLRRAGGFGLDLALAALAVATRVTLSYWQDSRTLFTHAERMLNKPDELIEVNLGNADDSLNQPEEALRHYEIAEAVKPYSYLARFDIGTYLLQHGRTAESIPEFQAAIQYRPSQMLLRRCPGNLGNAYLLLGQDALAEPAFAEALRLFPNSPPALFGHGRCSGT